MAASLRLSASTPKALLIEALTPRRLGNITPKGWQAAASPFHMDLEQTSPMSSRNCFTPSSFCITPKAPSAAVASLLTALAPLHGMEQVSGTTDMSNAVEGYPRLLGWPVGAPSVSAAVKPRVGFNDDAQQLAEDARAACLAMRQRIGGRTLPKQSHAENERARLTVSCGKDLEEPTAAVPTATVAPESAEAHPVLLGRPGAMPALSVAAKRVRFDGEAKELAEGAHAAFLARRARMASRRLPKQSD